MAESSQPKESASEEKTAPSEPSTQNHPEAAIDDDSDPDFDDLDDVLDQFSAATSSHQQEKSQPPQPTPSSSGPGRPPTETPSALPPDLAIPTGPREDESEEQFMARLAAEMSEVMSKISMDPAASATNPADMAKMGQELEEFTQKMEAEGIQPEDLLKAILGQDIGAKVGEAAHQEHDRRESESRKAKSKSRSPEASRAAVTDDRPGSSSSSATKTNKQQSSSAAAASSSFEDTIRRTMARMESSSAAATSATTSAQQQKSEEDLLADMLRALESGAGGAGGGSGEDGDLSKMFLGMMEQLTNKDMLYEPMKELSQKFPDYLSSHDPSSLDTSTTNKLSKAEFDRYTRQNAIVSDIVRKFEEKSYNDADPKCREFIWEKMQEMQGEGAPPEELIANPFPGMGGLLGGGDGEGAEGVEEGCPTQ